MKSKRRQIKELKAQVVELLPYKERWERTLANKRGIAEKRRGLFKFFGYKNYFGTKPRYWPDVLCCDCKNAIPDGRASVRVKCKQQKWKCKILGTRVGKYGSCSQKELKH